MNITRFSERDIEPVSQFTKLTLVFRFHCAYQGFNLVNDIGVQVIQGVKFNRVIGMSEGNFDQL